MLQCYNVGECYNASMLQWEECMNEGMHECVNDGMCEIEYRMSNKEFRILKYSPKLKKLFRSKLLRQCILKSA